MVTPWRFAPWGSNVSRQPKSEIQTIPIRNSTHGTAIGLPPQTDPPYALPLAVSRLGDGTRGRRSILGVPQRLFPCRGTEVFVCKIELGSLSQGIPFKWKVQPKTGNHHQAHAPPRKQKEPKRTTGTQGQGRHEMKASWHIWVRIKAPNLEEIWRFTGLGHYRVTGIQGISWLTTTRQAVGDYIP